MRPKYCINNNACQMMRMYSWLSLYMSIYVVQWNFPELQQGSDRLNYNQTHVLMWYAIKINCTYINEQVTSIFSCSICAPIRSWSDISAQHIPSLPPGELCCWRPEISSRRPEISSRWPEILYRLINMYQLKILTCPPGWRCPRCLP